MERPGGLPYFRKVSGSDQPVRLLARHTREQLRVVEAQRRFFPEALAARAAGIDVVAALVPVARPALGTGVEGERRVGLAVVGSNHAGKALDPHDVDRALAGDHRLINQHVGDELLVVCLGPGSTIIAVANDVARVDHLHRIMPSVAVQHALQDDQALPVPVERIAVGLQALGELVSAETTLQPGVGVDGDTDIVNEKVVVAHGLLPCIVAAYPSGNCHYIRLEGPYCTLLVTGCGMGHRFNIYTSY